MLAPAVLMNAGIQQQCLHLQLLPRGLLCGEGTSVALFGPRKCCTGSALTIAVTTAEVRVWKLHAARFERIAAPEQESLNSQTHCAV